MKTFVHSRDFSIVDIMLAVQKEGTSDQFEPIEVKIGRGTFKIQTAESATMFSLGICSYIDAKEESESWTR